MVGSQNFLLIRDKIKKKLMEKEKEKASFTNSVIIPNSSRSEGLALLWKRDITVEVQGYSGKYADAIVTDQAQASSGVSLAFMVTLRPIIESSLGIF